MDIPDNQTLGGFGLMALINTNIDSAYEGQAQGEDAVWVNYVTFLLYSRSCMTNRFNEDNAIQYRLDG